MIYKGYLISNSTNKMIRTINVIGEEERYFAEKFLGREDLINIRVRENIPRLRKIAAAFKYYYSVKDDNLIF